VLDSKRDGAAFLAFRDGDGRQRILRLEGDRLKVGRDADSDLALLWDGKASRLHALLEGHGRSWTVVDDGLSRNGTLVNGVPVRGRRRLNDGDAIQFGTTEVLFRDPVQGADETVPGEDERSPAGGVTASQRRVLIALCRPLVERTDAAAIPLSNPEIARELVVTVEAVRTHMKALFRLFEVPELPQNQKRAELARRALVTGVVTSRDVRG
jgi:pSer/pThr/pTyr-binding forkhead associated (FHA) protein